MKKGFYGNCNETYLAIHTSYIRRLSREVTPRTAKVVACAVAVTDNVLPRQPRPLRCTVSMRVSAKKMT